MTNSYFNALRRGCSTLAISLVVATASASASQAYARAVSFNIAPKNTAQALIDFSKQAEVQVLFPYAAAAEFEAPALRGDYPTDVALSKLIAGTTLQIASVSDKTITLKVSDKSNEEPSTADKPTGEVVVTGTHIRGGKAISPLRTVTRAEIDRSGYSQIGDLMRSLPENFSGGQNPGVIAAYAGNAENYNISNASTINLRGLGTGATLVLLDCHRLASDSYFQGADISGIPLAAVERIEVVTDGSSALYGSDAVAGVANIILRKRFSGTELSTRFGTSTQGGGEEQSHSLLFGRAGDAGYALVNLEYAEQDEIKARQRKLTSGATADSTLMQPQTRRSLFVAAGRDLSDIVSIKFDGLISDRDTGGITHYSTTSTVYHNSVYTPQYSAAVSLNARLPHNWNLRASTGASGSRNASWSRSLAGNSKWQYANEGQYFEFAVDGTLFSLPGGDVKLAVGGGYRREGYTQNWKSSTTFVDVDRGVTSVFAEARAPIVQPDPDRAGLNELELSLSGRSETYSDFGTASTPKFGLRYVPLPGLTLRGTWGESFKAPSFYQMYSASNLYIYRASLFGNTSGGTVLRLEGGNPELSPETSSSWTAGFDFRPANVTTLSLSGTWFGIDYKNRVVQPITNIRAALTDPIYVPFVDYAPAADVQSKLVAQAFSFSNFSGAAYSPSSVVAVVRNAYQNATAQQVEGMDLSYRQEFTAPVGGISVFANGTWLKVQQKTLPTLPAYVLSGTIFNVPKFKARAGLTWQTGGFAATGIVNHVADESDTSISPAVRIASWTTADANLSYRFAATSRWSSGLKASFAVTNLFDRAPPKAAGPSLSYGGIAFDSANASIVGRFVSLTLAKAW